MNAVDVLKKQHREVEKLFKQALKAEKPAERRQLMETIEAKLTVHTTIEEEIFYPAFKDVGTKKADDMTLEALEEHHVVKLVLAELPQVDPKADTFEAKMKVLSELVDHHVQEEQDEMFPMAEKKLGEETLAQLGEQLTARTAELDESAPQPHTPLGMTAFVRRVAVVGRPRDLTGAAEPRSGDACRIYTQRCARCSGPRCDHKRGIESGLARDVLRRTP